MFDFWSEIRSVQWPQIRDQMRPRYCPWVKRMVRIGDTKLSILAPLSGPSPGVRIPQEGMDPPDGSSLAERVPLSSLVTRNRANRVLMRSLGSRPVLCTSPTNEAAEGGQGQPWWSGGGLPLAGGVTMSHKSCAWVRSYSASQSKVNGRKRKRNQWHLKALVISYPISPYFGAGGLTVVW